MVRMWDEVGVRTWDIATPEAGRTIVYRGCEIVRRADGRWAVWWLAVSGREGMVGTAPDETQARRLVDATWKPIEEGEEC